jgi:hypothetical protein
MLLHIVLHTKTYLSENKILSSFRVIFPLHANSLPQERVYRAVERTGSSWNRFNDSYKLEMIVRNVRYTDGGTPVDLYLYNIYVQSLLQHNIMNLQRATTNISRF